ncbi:hypothetical protein J3R83DRAFT_12607, partial [Lanmaoa asiatica]
IAGSKILGPLTLALLIYTISLHLAISTRFLQVVVFLPNFCLLRGLILPQNCSTLSRLLHIVPFLGITCMAAVELVTDVQSPALAAGTLLVGALSSLIMAIYHAR